MKKKIGIALLTLLIFAGAARAQEVKESVQPLSKKAKRGFLYSVGAESGNTDVTYKIKGDKKGDTITFEQYSFDKNLQFLGSKDISIQKSTHEDYEKTIYYATVGGCTSFDILSMKLKLTRMVFLKRWNQQKNRYYTKKTISSETIKAKNDNGKSYKGFASYYSSDDNKSQVFVLAKNDSKEKGEEDKFYIVLFDDKLELKEKPVDLNGNYTLAYCAQMPSDNVVMVFAPTKGSADLTKYVYMEYDIEGNLKNKVEFTSPASALLITESYERDGDVYLCGASKKSDGAFGKVFSEYAPIDNPCYKTAANFYDDKWERASEASMKNFHILKFSGSKLAFASTTPINEFKSKLKKAGKGGDAYNGKKFSIEKFYVTPDGDFLIAGQLTGKEHLGVGNPVKTYNDLLCLHFDKNGVLKAQYSTKRMNSDKKSAIFNMSQEFYPSADGKTVYWEILEVKGAKGYADFADALNGVVTFYPKYFPRIAKIDLSATSVGDFKMMGDKKYFLNKSYMGSFDATDKSIVYIGHDDGFKKLWIGKVYVP